MADAGNQDIREEPQYLSFNTTITPSESICPKPKDDDLDRLKKVDPRLLYTWTVWEQHVAPKDKKVEYADLSKPSVSFNTVKEFWACWNHLPQPSELLQGKKFTRQQPDGSRVIVDSLMIFRQGVKPEWEAPENVKGGHFQLQLKPQLGGGAIDELWNNIVLGMIGGGIEPSDMINGVRLVDKLGHKTKPVIRIELWFNDLDTADTGRLYNLRGNFERCMGTGLDGNIKKPTWGNTEKVQHQTNPGGRKH
mmetsp:Transcript_18831/g.36953  ORF Transcript_18831/g.36953 Transcript_18831/m.36953 type:complete len:250 (-) Transcript_18831:359-1108(-)